MKITFAAMGDLREYLDREPQTVELPDQATVQDLLSWIEETQIGRLPAYLWDAEKHAFRGPVYLIANKKVILDQDMPLNDGMTIHLMRAMVGGCA